MKRINNRPVAVEAVLTRNGTIVGPFMSELTGHPELTPYRGGWCGNEMYPEVLTEELRRKAGDLVARLGDRLGAEGYRGFFEVDVLVDTDTDEVYLGSSTLGSAAPPRSPMSPPARTQTSPCSPSTSWSTSMSLSSSTSMRSTPDGENSLRSISGARW